MSVHLAPKVDLDYERYNRLVDKLVAIAGQLRAPDPVQAAQAALDAAWENEFAREGLLRHFGAAEPEPEVEAVSGGILFPQLIAWLRTTVGRVALRQRTKERTLPFSQVEPPDGVPFEERITVADRSPEGQLVEKRHAQMLEKAVDDCLRRLSKQQRQVIELRREGKSYEEIASIVDAPRATVGTWLHRACQEMKRCLQRKGVIHGSA